MMMSEIIREILDVVERDPENDYCAYDGYTIITDKQTISIGIDNGQSCCEDWGVMTSEDDLNDFRGASLLAINIVDTALNVKKWEKELPYGLDDGGAIFINIETNKGTFQIALYNSHNGYYGHSAFIISDQVQERVCL